MGDARVHPSADIDDDVAIGDDSAVWHLAHLRSGARIGAECVVGRAAYIGPGVVVGDLCKIQNGAQLHHPAELGRGVFIGPGVILTNDRRPRAVTPDFVAAGADEWDADGVTIADGASIGAGSVIVAGVSIGAWALVGAGSTVTRDVPAHGLVAGSPARHMGWVGTTGHRLVDEGDSIWRCPQTGDRYDVVGDEITRSA